MAYKAYRVLFWVAVSSCLTATLTKANERIEATSSASAKVGMDLRVAFVRNAKPVNMTCKSGGFFALRNTQHHSWEVPINDVETCEALWGHSEANFTAYNPPTDMGHTLIFLFAKFDGFFHSYDNLTWTKWANWNH